MPETSSSEVHDGRVSHGIERVEEPHADEGLAPGAGEAPAAEFGAGELVAIDQDVRAPSRASRDAAAAPPGRRR